MRNKHYKPYCFRLNEETNDTIKKLAEDNNISKNLLFLSFIKLAQKHGLPKLNEHNRTKK